jgi:Fe-S-cluster containining protein
MEILMQVLEKDIDVPFRKGKYNVAPDNEECKSCGKCCNTFGTMQLEPLDFEDDKVAEGLRWLVKHKLLFLKLINDHEGTGFFEVMMLQLKNCYFLGEQGCLLDAGTRPLVCGHYGPIKFTKAGKPRKNKKCGGLTSGWLTNLMEERYGKYSFASKRWREYTSLLRTIYNEELTDDRKIEIFQNLSGVRIVNPYKGFDVLYKKVREE